MSAERADHNDAVAFTPTGADVRPPDGGLVERLQDVVGARFRVLGVVGEGPVGLVFRVRDVQSRTRDELALKLVSLEPEGAQLAYERARHVARVSAAADHPRVVVAKVDNVEAAVFYTMPFFPGGSLEDVLASGKRLSFDSIAAIVTELAAALDHLHSRRVIHGGVKPTNILFDGLGRPFLSDVGVSEVFAVSARNGYAAPEQWRGLRLDARADQYSLAVIAYELLTGERRSNAGRVEGIAVLDPIEISGTTPLRPDVGTHLNAVLRKALSPGTANRFASVSEFADALAGRVRLSESALVVEREPARPVRKRHVAAVVAVIAVLAAGASMLDADVERGVIGVVREIAILVEQSDSLSEVNVPEVPDIPGGSATAGTVVGQGTSGGGSRGSGSSGGSAGSSGAAGPFSSGGGRAGAPASPGAASGPGGASQPKSASPLAGRTAPTGDAAATFGSGTTGRTSKGSGGGAASGAVAPGAGSSATGAPATAWQRVGRWFERLTGGADSTASDSAGGAPSVPTIGLAAGSAASAGSSAEQSGSSAPAAERPARQSKAASRSAALNVNTVGGSAIVLVDGVPRGMSPTIISVSPGWHRVEVRSVGAKYTPQRRQVAVGAKDTLTLEFMRVVAPR